MIIVILILLINIIIVILIAGSKVRANCARGGCDGACLGEQKRRTSRCPSWIGMFPPILTVLNRDYSTPLLYSQLRTVSTRGNIPTHGP